ncbi:Bcr/CflA family multidrug efflux MFS transporter [Ferrimonas senticii]|uniref:Bcr/CflA family multidrug efflux MFS transporter n=1 Tax=Ferrimonas senticii TaxID=394566 RepID=UPI000421F5E6|nr:Bcr/CflA family multidrug efflux MFS transporter [Ferrimonas senticii]
MRSTSYPVIIAILGLVAGLTPFAIDMYLPALPAIASDFAVNTEQVQLTVSIYLLFFGAGQLLFGPLTDALGRLKVMNGGLLLFAVASLGCVLSESLNSLLLWRALQAIGGAATSVVLMGMIRDRFQKEEFARAISFVMLVMQLAPLLAPIMGGYLLKFAGWHSLFVFLVLIAITMIVAVTLGIGETLVPEKRSELSFRGALRTYRQVLTNGYCMSYLAIGIMTAGSLFAFITNASFVYIEFFDLAPQHFGYVFGLNIGLMMLCTSINARYVGRYGTRRMLGWALWLGLIGAVLLVLARLLLPDSMWGITIPVMLILGPLGIISANGTSLALEPFAHAAGSVAALGGFMRFTWGAAVGVAISTLHTGTPLPLVVAMAACSAAALAIYLIQGRTEARA